jgi:hypothetical protein
MKPQDRGTLQLKENQPEHGKSNATNLTNCCDPETFDEAEMMRGCPCAGLMRGSKKTFLGVLAGAGLLFSVVVAGWVLGIVAFLRTL